MNKDKIEMKQSKSKEVEQKQNKWENLTSNHISALTKKEKTVFNIAIRAKLRDDWYHKNIYTGAIALYHYAGTTYDNYTYLTQCLNGTTIWNNGLVSVTVTRQGKVII